MRRKVISKIKVKKNRISAEKKISNQSKSNKSSTVLTKRRETKSKESRSSITERRLNRIESSSEATVKRDPPESSRPSDNPPFKSNAISSNSQFCTVCRDAACLRIVLRNCGHIICVACFLGYLQGQIALKARVEIRCPSGRCAQEVHENDIHAVFDEKEPGLDAFLSPIRRQWLQYCHDKDSIIMGLAGPDPKNQDYLTKRCPLCKNIYYKRFGCNNVVCPNLRCKTNFCWTCGNPIRGIGHFAGGKCHVAYDDVMRGSVAIPLLNEINTIVFLFAYPISFTFCYIVFPFLVLFAFGYYSAQRVYRHATRFTDFLTYWEWISLIPQIVIATIFGLLIGLPVSVMSIFTGVCLFILYNAITLLKFCGIFRKLIKRYDSLLPMARLLGLTHIRNMLKEGREEKAKQKERRAAEEEREAVCQADILVDEITPLNRSRILHEKK